MNQRVTILDTRAGEGHGSEQSRRRLVGLVLFLLLLVATACSCLSLVVAARPTEARYLEIDVHSRIDADYSEDPDGLGWEPFGPKLIADVIRDTDPDDPDILQRITEIANDLLTPVPTSTGAAPAGPGAPTVTPTATMAFAPTAAPTAIVPAETPTIPQEETSTPTPTNTPRPTRPPPTTAPRPTNTPATTNTPTEPPPTNTPIPEPTATPNLCAGIALGPITLAKSDTRADITNNSISDITIIRIQFIWPFENGPLKHIKLASQKIWNGNMNPPADITTGWTGANRTIPMGSTNTLRLFHDEPINRTGIWLTVMFQNGCYVNSVR